MLQVHRSLSTLLPRLPAGGSAAALAASLEQIQVGVGAQKSSNCNYA